MTEYRRRESESKRGPVKPSVVDNGWKVREMVQYIAKIKGLENSLVWKLGLFFTRPNK